MHTSFRAACFTYPPAAEQPPQFPVCRDCTEKEHVLGHPMKLLKGSSKDIDQNHITKAFGGF